MKKKLLKLAIASFLFFFFTVFAVFAAVTPASADRLQEIQQEIEEYQQQIERLQETKKTLQNQISQFNAQIRLTELKIEETQEKIAQLGGRIDLLEISLQSLTEAFSSRATETYKMARLGDPLVLLVTSKNLSEAVTRFHYLQRIQEADRELLVKLQGAQDTYEVEKEDQEDLQAELQEQQRVLGVQKEAKAELLRVTESDESRYQDLLEQAQRELAALAASEFTGKKEVKRGDIIGLMGNTGFSFGSHLHFGYYNLTEDEHNGEYSGGIGWYSSRHTDPRSVLQNRSLTTYDSTCPVPIGNGSSPWPLSDPYITQCYGNTPYSSVYEGGFHRGLDMSTNGAVAITVVDDGVAYFYRGATSFGNNVRVFHPNGKMSLYMHLQ